MLFPQGEVFESRLHFIDTWLSDRSMPFASIEHEDSAQMRIEEIDEIRSMGGKTLQVPLVNARTHSYTKSVSANRNGKYAPTGTVAIVKDGRPAKAGWTRMTMVRAPRAARNRRPRAES